MEETIFQIIMCSGDARSCVMEAIQAAKKGDFKLAEHLVNKCDKQLENAHNIQTQLIQTEASGNKTEVSLLLIHAQDHLMTAMTTKFLAIEIIELYKKILDK